MGSEPSDSHQQGGVDQQGGAASVGTTPAAAVEPRAETQARGRHVVALAAGVASIVAMFVVLSGFVGYLIWAGAGLIAVSIGHWALRSRGPLMWAAGVGLAISYLALLVSVLLMVTHITRLLASSSVL